MAKEDSKVFDVAKPGETKPETGSKPMVVGHKIMKDPSVSETPEEKDSKEEQPIAQTSKKTIAPISDKEKESEKTDESVDDEKNEDNTAEDNVASSEEKVDSPKEKDQPVDSAIKEKTSEEIEKEKSDEALNNEENLQRIINEKKYFVSIDEASYSSTKTFIKTFLIVGLLATVVLVVLFDLEILDLGITLPFDLL